MPEKSRGRAHSPAAAWEGSLHYDAGTLLLVAGYRLVSIRGRPFHLYKQFRWESLRRSSVDARMTQVNGAPGLERQTFDQEYVKRLIAGDPETEAHFTGYFGQLLNLKLRARLRSWQALEDVRQETFLRVFRTLRTGEIQQPERLGAFVNSVCNNVLFESFRSEKRASQLPEEGIDLADESPGPDAEFLSEEKRRHVQKALAELPDKDREVLRAVFLHDEDKDAVCRRFDVDREYLRVLVHRAKNRLRLALEKAQAVSVRLLMAIICATLMLLKSR
jgi:RNA polymerase sigma-70 factor, ECF subfamily